MTVTTIIAEVGGLNVCTGFSTSVADHQHHHDRHRLRHHQYHRQPHQQHQQKQHQHTYSKLRLQVISATELAYCQSFSITAIRSMGDKSIKAVIWCYEQNDSSWMPFFLEHQNLLEAMFQNNDTEKPIYLPLWIDRETNKVVFAAVELARDKNFSQVHRPDDELSVQRTLARFADLENSMKGKLMNNPWATEDLPTVKDFNKIFDKFTQATFDML